MWTPGSYSTENPVQMRITGFESAPIEIGPRALLDKLESLVLSIGILAALASPALAQQNVDTVVTNESGYFTKERMLPGVYEVKAELTGFKSAVIPSVVVNVDTKTPLTIKLGVGQLTETVEVTGGSPLLRTDRADVASAFDRKQLTDLPVIDRLSQSR